MRLNTVRNPGLTLLTLIAVAGLACDQDGGRDGAADTGGQDSGDSTGGQDTGGPAVTSVATTVTTLPPVGDDSSGGEGSTGSGGETGPDDTGGDPTLTCDNYCAIYMDACSDFSLYANTQECMDHCGQWPIGTEADTAGDSLGCRLYHVTVANSTDPDVHCPHSGPTGDEVCVDEAAPDCQTYCDTYMGNCTGDDGVYADMADCLDQCAPWYPGVTDEVDGNSIGCRTYHAGAPAFGDPTLHCPHAGPGGAGVCVF